MNHPLCPYCGYDFVKDEVVEADGFKIDPNNDLEYRGVRAGLTRMEVQAVHAIAKMRGTCITVEALTNRISEATDSNVVAVILTRVRHKLREANIPIPFENLMGRGHRWRSGITGATA